MTASSVASPPAATTCVAASAADVSLPGTAAQVAAWVCLEHPAGWGRDVFAGDAFGPELSARLQAHVEAAGVRLLLTRHPGRTEVRSSRTVLFARSSPDGTWCERFEVSSPADLLDIDLTATVAAPGIGVAVTDPVVLVCAHGKRDRCCAVLGRPVAAALAQRFGDAVWECSHTGGHRFAPSMVLLPTGNTYGRLDVEQSVAAVDAAARGEVYLPGLRGRSCWTPAGQVAEIAVRQRVPAAADDLGVSGPEGRPVVRHRDGRAWQVDVGAVDLPPRPASCGAEPTPARSLVAGEVTRVDVAG